MKLYDYFRSSASYRVRIALNLKRLSYDAVPIHLSKDGGRQKTPEYRAINPQMRVPALVLSNGDRLIQSLAIIEYLDETFPDPALLPVEAVERAQVRAVAQIIACDIHPINNTSTLSYLRKLGHDQTEIDEWYASWILSGFEAVETMIRPAPYAFGSHVTIADLCIIPQVFNARRFKVPIDRFPKIASVDSACNKLSAFDNARPEKQPDAE
jgi:maleylacetoacetate isomerase